MVLARAAPPLYERGHEVIAVDLPVTDPSAGLEECAAGVIMARVA